LSKKKYFFIADLLGFSNIVNKSNELQLDERIQGWITLIEEAASYAGVIEYQLISDTLFASAGETEADLCNLIRFSQYLMNNGIRKSLPVRGAICFGEYTWGKLTYGKAVVKAHMLESCQNWIGIVCDSGIMPSKEHFRHGFLIKYPAPMKDGKYRLLPVVDWGIPPASELKKILGNGGLAREGEFYSWKSEEKFNNTIQFSMYKQIAKENNHDVSTFLSTSVVEYLENHLVSVRQFE